MSFYYYTLFVVFAVLIYMMSVDKNVGDYILLVFKFVNSLIMRAAMHIQLHPIVKVNFITKWKMQRKYEKETIKMRKDLGID